MSKKTKNNEIYLYHGTTEKSAKTIMEHGFKPDTKYNWNVKSKKGFVYLSVSYAPFYAMNSGKGRKALVKVKINLEDAYPEDDFIMYALGKGKYTQEELDEINLEDFKQYAFKSLRYMGNVAVKPKDVEVVGYTSFDDKRLWQVCDPVMSPLNFKILGVYYKELSDWIYHFLARRPPNSLGG